MGIRAKGYAGWEGALTLPALRWLPIFRNGVRGVAKRKYSRFIFLLGILHFLSFLLIVYAIAKPELRMLTHFVRELQSDASLFKAFYTNGFILFYLIVISIFTGAELVCSDLRLKALPLYFSRPLTKTGYILGKLSVILFYLLLFTLVPGLLLLLLKMVFTGKWILDPGLLVAMVGFPLVTGVFCASLTLFLSTLSEKVNFVRIILVAVFFFSDALANILREATHSSAWQLLSVMRNINQAGACLFGQPAQFNADPFVSLVIMAALSAVAVAWLYIRIERAEALA